MAQAHPVIAVSGASAESKSVTAMMSLLRASGADPIFLSNHRARIGDGRIDDIQAGVARDLKDVSAVVVMGNDGDIDPAKYGQKKHPKTNIEQDPARAAYEEELVRQAVAAKVPLLGVCGGMQRINVAYGGTLHQHVPELTGNEEHAQGDIPPFVPVQFVAITGDSTLHEICNPPGFFEGIIKKITGLFMPAHHADAELVAENSFHHQSIDRVAPGFRVNAVSIEPGRPHVQIVEGIEADPKGSFGKQYIMGVQFHPEYGASPVGGKVVEDLIERARAYAREHAQIMRPSREVDATMLSIAPAQAEKIAAKFSEPEPGGMVEYILNRRQAAAARVSR